MGRDVPEMAGSKETKPVPLPPCKDTWTVLDELGLINAASGQRRTLPSVWLPEPPGQTLHGPEAEICVWEQGAPAPTRAQGTGGS